MVSPQWLISTASLIVYRWYRAEELAQRAGQVLVFAIAIVVTRAGHAEPVATAIVTTY
jgi:hypothetical protein